MRLYITGVGLVTALGLGVEATWRRLVRGERGIRPVERFATEGYRARLGAEVVGLSDVPPAEGAWSRTALMAYEAAREAVAASRLEIVRRAGHAPRVGLIVAASTGGMLENEELLSGIHADPGYGASPERFASMLRHPLWATADRLNETLGPFVRVRTLSSACSAGANALILGAAWLLSGEVDSVVAGGTDGLCRLTFSGFNALAAVDPEPCRPFDVRRRGLNLGEGAGFVVLERDDVARARAATPLVELAGWSLGAEAHHITNPEPTGATAGRVLRGAIARAGLSPAQIDYVNAHGTATPLNDPMEAAAIALALGDEAVARVPVSSSKGQVGHTLAAAGAIEAVVTALVVARQTLVPTAGLEQIDPACARLVHVPGAGRPARVRAALTNAFGFGGMDSALVLAEPELAPPHAPKKRAVVVTAASTFTPEGLHGTRDAHRVLAPATSTALPSPDALLDLERARRLDRPARLGAIVVGRALADSEGLASASPPVGVILGTNFGSVDASAAFIHRVFTKGPRAASPADFPNLVQSSPVGHVSIYLGLRGPVLAAVELGATGECAALQAAELVAAGEADAIVAGDTQEANGVVERMLVNLFAADAAQSTAERGEGGGAVVLEAEESARARGAEPVARIAAFVSWHDGARGPLPRPSLPPPSCTEDALVVLPRVSPDVEAFLVEAKWGGVRREVCDGAGGEHEARGIIAMAAAVSWLARGEAKEALVVGLAQRRGYAVVLVAP